MIGIKRRISNVYGTMLYALSLKNIIGPATLQKRYESLSLGEENTYTLSVEADTDLPCSSFKKHLGTYNPSESTVYTVKDGYIVGNNGLLINQQGKIIFPTTGSLTRIISNYHELITGGDPPFENILFSTGLSETTKVNSDYIFPLTGIWSDGYYHWLIEYLPKVRQLLAYEQHTTQQAKILIEENMPEYKLQSLSLLGVPRDRIITWGGGIANVEKIVVPTHRFATARLSEVDISADSLVWLRKSIRKNIKNNIKDTKKIYIPAKCRQTKSLQL